MSNYSVLKQDINNNIYENQTQQITGTVLNAILNEMTASLGAGYQFAGVATLGMNPGDPDQRVFYLAGEGIYTNFGGLQVPAGKLGVLKWDNRWTLQTIDGLGGGGANLTGYVSVASTDDLPEEGQPTLGYLCGTNLYLYVGEGGDTKEGKYQDCGSFRGPEGAYIQDIEQTETSHENGGRNTIKMTLSDGRSFNAYVHNGTTSSGLFPTVEALQAAYPNPVVGQYAFVGAGFPADIYVCTTAGTWTDSGEDYDGDNVDLTDYATKAEVNKLEAKVIDMDQELNGTAMSFVPSWQRPGYYLNTSGTPTASSTWNISSPFILKKGQTIEVKTQGSGACIIAATDDGQTYTPLVNAPSGISGLKTYTYTATSDQSIALSVKWGLGDVTIRTYMVDVRTSVYELNDAFKTIGKHTIINESQSVASGGRLNKTIDLSAYDGMIAKMTVTKTGGTSTMFNILIGSSSVVGSQFQYGVSATFVLDSNIDHPLFYGRSAEESSAEFEIKVELFPNYGIKDADKKMFLQDNAFGVTVGYYYNTNYSTLPTTPVELDGAACATGNIREGDILAVRGNGASQYVGLYAFYDSERRKIYSAGSAYLANRNELQIIAPEGAAYFVFNSSTYNPQTDSCIVRSSLIIRSAISELQEKVNLLHPTRFAGKTIVCFGDSQTEFSDQYGKRYADYLADYTGANVVSVGIGGTRISCRATPTATPASSMDGYADLDCPSLIEAVSTNDYTIVDAGAEWVRDNAGDDNTPIIARLKAIDWTNVDAVTFLIGTNDWGGEANIGTSGEVNKRTVFGAINYIISTLLSAYPNLNVYWFTPIVRWITPWTDENWGGTLQKAGRTLEQFVELVKTEVAKQNIPVCDMYHTLGWNKYNFGQYFYSTDGTHPTKGYFNIGRKIASFISANRSF